MSPSSTSSSGQLLLRAPSRAFVRVGVLRGFATAWVAEEGQAARELDRLLSARFTTLQAERLGAALQRGLDLEDALARAGGPAMPTIVARTHLAAGPGRSAVAIHYEEAGSVALLLERSALSPGHEPRLDGLERPGDARLRGARSAQGLLRRGEVGEDALGERHQERRGGAGVRG